MSCNQSSRQVSLAARRSGVGQLASQAGEAVGRLVASLRQGLGRSATMTLRAVESLDPPSPDALWGAAILVGALKGGRAGRDLALNLTGAAKLGSLASAGAGKAVARLSRVRAEGVSGGMSEAFFFKSNTPARFWPSRLTPWFNSGDIGLTGHVLASQGKMVEVDGRAWHYGHTVLGTRQGERAIVHLQSLSWPRQHLYFNRPLSNQELVGVIAGQKGFDPKRLEGYAGQVSATESLSPALAQAKRALIRTHLLWGEPQTGGR